MKVRFFCCLFFLFAFVGSHAQQLIRFSGKVTGVDASPLAGSSVYLLNTNHGTVSDANGKFELRNIIAGHYVLQVSSVGYATVTLPVVLDGSTKNELTIQLKETTTQLDAVVVSAQKREETLQQVPFSISTISARQVQQYRLWNAQELTAIVPNLYAANPGDERNVTSIRGITATSYDPAVATYIDGVNQFGLDTYIAQLLDVERIEVLRGPQGTLYGRNAMGGVINIISKKPSNKITGFTEITLGNYAQQRYSAGVQLPLVKNKLFAGASALYSSRAGFYTNEFNNSDFDRQKNFTGNYYLKFIASDKWTMNLNVKHNGNRNNGAFPLVNGAEDALNNPFRLNQDATATMIDHTLNASFVVNYAGKPFSFSSQTAYQSNHRYYNQPLDGDFSPIDGVTVINDYGDKWNKVKVWTQEFKFSSPASSASSWKWTAGSYLFHQYNPAKQAIHFGKDAGMLGAPDTDFSLINSTKGTNSGAAFFGQTSYAVTNKLSVIAGLRYDYEHKKYSVLGEYQKAPDPAVATRPDTSASANFAAFSPKLGLLYEITAYNNFYATYSRGYRTGGLTQLSTDPSQPPLHPYKPEYSNNIEIGSKNNFLNNRLRINVAAFLTYVTNAQVPTLILPDAITVTRNAGRLTSKGAELELAATPFKGMELDYHFGYTDAVYKNLKLAQQGNVVNLDGKKQIFTPNVTSMLAAQYSVALSRNKQLKLTARGEWMYVGEQYFDLANSIRQKGYSLLNARVGLTCKFAELMFWGRNLTHAKYIAYAYDFGAVHLGDPQTYGVTFTTRF